MIKIIRMRSYGIHFTLKPDVLGANPLEFAPVSSRAISNLYSN